MLTETLIRKTKAPRKPTKLADERGMYLFLTPAGGRLWRFKYRFQGKEKLLALGAYSPTPNSMVSRGVQSGGTAPCTVGVRGDAIG